MRMKMRRCDMRKKNVAEILFEQLTKIEKAQLSVCPKLVQKGGMGVRGK
jgi:hypothetical protein